MAVTTAASRTATAGTTPAGTTPARSATIVLVGHGMVGQRFLEALAARGVTGWARVVVLCEEPRPAYDRVHLTSYFSEGASPEELSMVEDGFLGRTRDGSVYRRLR